MSTIQEASSLPVQMDYHLEYVPILSSVTNFSILVARFGGYIHSQVSANAKRPSEIQPFFEFEVYIREKSLIRCIALLIPVLGNIVVYVSDCLNRKYDDPIFMLQEIKKDPAMIQKSSKRLMRDQGYWLKAIKKDCKVIGFIPKPFFTIDEFQNCILKTVQSQISNQDGELTKMAQKFTFLIPLLDKKDILEVIKVIGFKAFETTPEEYFNDERFDRDARKFAKQLACNNKEHAMFAIRRKLIEFKDLKKELRNDPEIALECIVKKFEVFNYISESLTDDDTFMRKAIACDGYHLLRASDRIKTSKWAIIAAANQNPAILHVLIERKVPLSDDVVLEILSKNCAAVAFLSEKVKWSPEVKQKIEEIKQGLYSEEQEL